MNQSLKINGKKFKTYTLDTTQSIKTRIATNLKTLPKYLYFTDSPDNTLDITKKDIKVKDRLKIIKDSAKDRDDFKKFLKKIKNLDGLNILSDIVEIWLSYNYKFSEQKEYVSLQFKSDVMPYFKSEESYNKFWEKTEENVLSNLEEKISNNKRKSENDTDVMKKIDNTEEIYSTDVELEKVTFNYKIKTKSTSILEVFNDLNLCLNVPYANINKFYKVLKDFVPNEEWLDNSEIEKKKKDDIIEVKIVQNKNISDRKKDYSTSYIQFVNNTLLVEMELSLGEKYLSQSDYIKRLLDSLNYKKSQIKEIKESSVRGVFYLPMQRLQKYIFADMVLNKQVFSRFIKLDESEKATKDKKWLYIYFKHPLTGVINATLSQKSRTRSDAEMRGKDSDIFPLEGEDNVYIRVRIVKARNKESIEIFKYVFSTLWEIYNNNYEDVVEFYRKYLDDTFGQIVVEVEEKKEEKLTDIAPHIFGKNYSGKKCSHIPTIVNDDILPQIEQEGKQVMKFPKDEEDSYNFICEYEDKKYPGLQVNKISSTNENYPLVPCCFKSDQSKRPGSEYRQYYFGDEPPKKDNKQQSLIISPGKILKHNTFGTLPKKLERFFLYINNDDSTHFLRKGVNRNENSFLEVVLDALQLDKNAKREREKFSADSTNFSLCRQEMYDYTTEDIKNFLKNQKQYLDPFMTVHLLEIIYSCNIYLFSMNKKTGVELSTPRHLQGYYVNKSKNPSIFIYIHQQPSDNTNYPQCELIVRTKKDTGETDYVFDFEENISKEVRAVYKSLRCFYSLNKVVEDLDTSFLNKFAKIKQIIDVYGKCRGFIIKYNQNLIYMLTSPFQPLKLSETKFSNDFDFPSKKAVLEFQKHYALKGVDDKFNNEIKGVNNNIIIRIPYKRESTTTLRMFSRYKKLARYLLEYTYWFYSKYIKETRYEIGDISLVRFFDEKVKISSGVSYGNISRKFSDLSDFISDGKLVVKNEETLKRLVFSLRMKISRSKLVVKEYHKNENIQEYYKDISDFDTKPNQIILYGEDSVENWIYNNKVSYKLYNNVLQGVREPYFFRNKLVENEIFLAQNSFSIENVRDLVNTWCRNKYNIGYFSYKSDVGNIILYAYKNSKEIKRLNFKNRPGGCKDAIRVLGYKIDGRPLYTVLFSTKQK